MFQIIYVPFLLMNKVLIEKEMISLGFRVICMSSKLLQEQF